MKEIQRLRVEHEQHTKANPAIAAGSQTPRNPTLLAELRLLRQRRDELETRMAALQESRRELMVQLEGLMKLLKVSCASAPGRPPRTPHANVASWRFCGVGDMAAGAVIQALEG